LDTFSSFYAIPCPVRESLAKSFFFHYKSVIHLLYAASQHHSVSRHAARTRRAGFLSAVLIWAVSKYPSGTPCDSTVPAQTHVRPCGSVHRLPHESETVVRWSAKTVVVEVEALVVDLVSSACLRWYDRTRGESGARVRPLLPPNFFWIPLFAMFTRPNEAAGPSLATARTPSAKSFVCGSALCATNSRSSAALTASASRGAAWRASTERELASPAISPASLSAAAPQNSRRSADVVDPSPGKRLLGLDAPSGQATSTPRGCSPISRDKCVRDPKARIETLASRVCGKRASGAATRIGDDSKAQTAPTAILHRGTTAFCWKRAEPPRHTVR